MKLSTFRARLFAGALSVAFVGAGALATTGCQTVGLSKGEKNVKMSDIPEAARKKIEKKTEGATITQLMTSSELGRDRYHVWYEKGGMKYEYQVGESGKDIN